MYLLILIWSYDNDKYNNAYFLESSGLVKEEYLKITE